jgi:hypothetical protein
MPNPKKFSLPVVLLLLKYPFDFFLVPGMEAQSLTVAQD